MTLLSEIKATDKLNIFCFPVHHNHKFYYDRNMLCISFGVEEVGTGAGGMNPIKW